VLHFGKFFFPALKTEIKKKWILWRISKSTASLAANQHLATAFDTWKQKFRCECQLSDSGEGVFIALSPLVASSGDDRVQDGVNKNVRKFSRGLDEEMHPEPSAAALSVNEAPSTADSTKLWQHPRMVDAGCLICLQYASTPCTTEGVADGGETATVNDAELAGKDIDVRRYNVARYVI